MAIWSGIRPPIIAAKASNHALTRLTMYQGADPSVVDASMDRVSTLVLSTRSGQIRRSSGFTRATATTTSRRVRATDEFVVDLVDEAVAEAMNETSASLPYGQNELETVGSTTAPSSVVKPPRIAEAPASLECTEWGTLQIGGNRLIIGLVKRVHVREELIDRETLRIRDERFHVIGRMASPNWYCRTQDRFEMIRPK